MKIQRFATGLAIQKTRKEKKKTRKKWRKKEIIIEKMKNVCLLEEKKRVSIFSLEKKT